MIGRRQFLQIVGAGAAGILTGGLPPLLSAGEASAAERNSSGFQPDLDLVLRAAAGEVPILPGDATGVWQYEGKVIKGERSSLVDIE